MILKIKIRSIIIRNTKWLRGRKNKILVALPRDFLGLNHDLSSDRDKNDIKDG